TADMKSRFSAGHNDRLKPVPYWDNPTLAGAGALRSSANDLLIFLSANMGLTDTPLKAAMAAMMSIRRPATAEMDVGLGWHIFKRQSTDLIWHDGGTYGFKSFIGFDPNKRIGVVVLSNASAKSVATIGIHLL